MAIPKIFSAITAHRFCQRLGTISPQNRAVKGGRHHCNTLEQTQRSLGTKKGVPLALNGKRHASWDEEIHNVLFQLRSSHSTYDSASPEQ